MDSKQVKFKGQRPCKYRFTREKNYNNQGGSVTNEKEIK